MCELTVLLSIINIIKRNSILPTEITYNGFLKSKRILLENLIGHVM